MVAKSQEVLDLDDVRNVLGVVFADGKQNFDFDLRLVVIALLVFDDLERQHFLLLVVEYLENLSVRTLSQVLDQLVPVSNVIIQHILVFSSVSAKEVL